MKEGKKESLSDTNKAYSQILPVKYVKMRRAWL